MEWFRHRLLAVFTKISPVLTFSVFFLFISSSSALADSNTRTALKEFASKCQQVTAKIVSNVGQKASDFGHKAIEKVKNIDPKDAAIATAKFPFQFTWAAAKGSVYPLWFIGKGGWEYFRSKETSRKEALKEVLVNRKEKDKLAMVIGGILWGLQQTTGLTVNQYHKLTSDFDEDDGEEGIIVVIDNFGDDALYAGAGSYVYNKLHKPKYGDRVFFLKDIPFEKIPAELKKLSEKHGPIKKVDYYGHGLVGKTVGHGTGGSPSDLVGSSSGYPGTPIQPRPGEMPSPLDPNGWSRDIFETKLEPTIFAKDAKIRFNSCFIGNGSDGDLFGRAIANSWLRRGGTVYTSNVQILPSVGEMAGLKGNLFIPPQFVRSITDQLVPLRGAITAYTLLHEIPTYVHNSDRMEGPFLMPSSKVRRHSTAGESPLRDEFEKAWSSGFDYNKVHAVYDSGDVRHYSPLRPGTPASIDNLLIKEVERAGNGSTTPFSVKLVFADKEKARQYMENVELDREMMDEPQYVSDGVILRMRSTAGETLKRREYEQQLSYATKAKEKLKAVYEKHKSSAPKDADKLYDEYRLMLPIYVFPRYMSQDLPKDPKLYKALEDLRSR